MTYQTSLYEQIKVLFSLKSKLRNHDVPNDQYIYRLHHIRYCEDAMGIQHEAHGIFEPFKFPKGMTIEEGFKVLSYFIDLIEQNNNLQECSLTAVNMLEDIINLESFGFERIDDSSSNIVDLFTIQGNVNKFKTSEYYSRYFNWYKEHISKEEIENIYKKIGIEFKDIALNKQKIKAR